MKARIVVGVALAGCFLACGGDDGASSEDNGPMVDASTSGGGGTAAGGANGSGGAIATDAVAERSQSGGGAGAATDATVPRDSAAPVLDECKSPGASWIFCSGFEEGSKSIWDDYDGNPDSTNMIVDDPGPSAVEGNHAMRFRVPPGRGGADLVKLLPANDKLYARWYIKYETGFDFSAPNHGGGLHAGSRDLLGRSDYRPTGNDWFTGWVEHTTDTHAYNVYSYYRGMYMDCADPNGQCWGDHFPCMVDQGQVYCTKPEHRPGVVPPTLTTDRWYCVELMMDGGAASQDGVGATGTLDFWVDGAEVGPWTGLWYRTTTDLKLGILWLNLFHHGDHSVAGVLYDDVVVSKDKVGCLR
jgi:hypothetical protein